MLDGLNCPRCNGKTRIAYTKKKKYGRIVIRRRDCTNPDCGFRRKTEERWVEVCGSKIQEAYQKIKGD